MEPNQRKKIGLRMKPKILNIKVLPGLNRSQIQVLMRELRKEQRIYCIGNTSAARWFEGPTPDETD